MRMRSALFAARLGSPRLAVALFGLLAAVVLGAHLQAEVPGWWAALPLALLAVNLAAAIVAHPVLRLGGLGVFHAALLGCMLLAAWGRLAHFEGRIELAEGAAFDAGAVEVLSAGPWHGDGLSALAFTQGTYDVRYAPGVQRAATRSRVRVGGEEVLVGEGRPLVLDGYRFSTTNNKGFAPILRWQPAQGAPGETMTGALHLPSYPLNDWRQDQRWVPPGGRPAMRFWLRPQRPIPEREAWVLSPAESTGTLVVEVAGQRFELRPGDVAAGNFGRLHFERLAGWMGYRIYRDPAMIPLLALAVAGVSGLAWHLWGVAPRRRAAAGARAVGGVAK